MSDRDRQKEEDLRMVGSCLSAIAVNVAKGQHLNAAFAAAELQRALLSLLNHDLKKVS